MARLAISRRVPDGKGSIFSCGEPRYSGPQYGSRRVHDFWQLRASNIPFCHPHRQCHDLHPFLAMCFDWSLLSGKIGRSTQTRQGPMLSNYSTVEHLGRSVDDGSGQRRSRPWTSLAVSFFLGGVVQTWSAAVDVSRAMTKKLENLLEAWSEALLPGAYAPELASEYAALSRVEVTWRLHTPTNAACGNWHGNIWYYSRAAHSVAAPAR